MKVEVAEDTGDKAARVVLGTFHLAQEQHSFPKRDHDCLK